MEEKQKLPWWAKILIVCGVIFGLMMIALIAVVMIFAFKVYQPREKVAFSQIETFFSAKDKRGITDVWEVVRNIELALGLPGGIYNFGSPNDKSTYEMVLDICKSLGVDSSYVHEMENANFRNLTMNQEKVKQFGITFSETEDGVICNLKRK